MDHPTRLSPEELLQWAGVDREGEPVTKTVAFTDVIDSTTLAGNVGDKEMFDILFRHFQRARHYCRTYEGVEIKLIGDAYMAAFRTPAHAMQFALDFRRDTGDARIAIRVGIHDGPVRIWEGDIYGLMVNYASRLCHIRVPGDEGIFLSDSAKDKIESEYGKTHRDFKTPPLPPTQLQGFGRRQVFQVITPEIIAARVARTKAKREEEARKNPKPIPSRVPDPQSSINTISPRYKPQGSNILNSPSTIPLRPRYKPEPDTKTLSQIIRGLSNSLDKKD